MKKTFVTLGLCLLAISPMWGQGLKDVVGKYFLIGTALNSSHINGTNTKEVELVKEQFNAIVAENCMKPESLSPSEGVWNWDEADKFVQFGIDNNITVTGHTLLWHSQAARWMFKDENGKLPNREVLIKRMRDYIHTVVGRYKGKIKGWDVINEAFLDNGDYSPSPWYRGIGPEYFELAFKFAHEADPNAELYYNDYSMSNPKKREAVVKLIKRLKAAGCRIDAVGMQSHNGLDYPDMAEYEKSIQAFINAGVKVMVTELDINVLPNPEGFSGAEISNNYELQEKYNPYTKKLPKEVEEKFNARVLEHFKIYKKYADNILRVTWWGVSDGESWLNGFPVRGRTNYPLLIDRKGKVKPVVKEIIKLFEEEK